MALSIQSIYDRVQGRKANILGQDTSTGSAVLLPLIKKNNQWQVLFEVRAHHLNRQPGEISFPGGRVEKNDRNEKETAIRETCEELGLSPGDIEIIGDLDIVMTSYQFMIYPYAARIKESAVIRPNPDEVHEIFSVPLDWLLDHDPLVHYVNLEVKPDPDFPYDLIPKGRHYPWRTRRMVEYFYQYGDYVIWGLTARILHHFLTLIRS
ncbi:MAG: CoA pyrophosphatase [Bacillaceae bacterium]|nr:CoA pyrophosphatase [Bacillaceae bacterium]